MEDGFQSTRDHIVQCLPVCKADTPQWTHRKVPKVSSFRSFDRIPFWCRKPQPFTYHVCAEDLTLSTLTPSLPDGDLQVLREGTIPQSPLPRVDIVTCPVRRGSPKLLPCCLCENWCHISCSYQTHLGRICPCHVRILDPRRKIIVMSHPYLEDYVVLPTRSTIRTDSRNIERDIGFSIRREDTGYICVQMERVDVG